MTRAISFAFFLLGVCIFSAHPAQATQIVYELSGVTHAPITNDGAFNPVNHNKEFTINWSGATITHDTGSNLNAFTDDVIRLSGRVQGCVGDAGANCFDDGEFKRLEVLPGVSRGIYVGAGTFEFQNANFKLDPKLTTGVGNIYAQMDKDVGKLELISQDLGKGSTLALSLKANPDVGYAFRLFDEAPTGDNVYRVFTWLLNDGWLFAGKARSETQPGEAVFNGNLFANCISGGTFCGPGPGPGPTPEVPEPATMLLLGASVPLIARMRARK